MQRVYRDIISPALRLSINKLVYFCQLATIEMVTETSSPWAVTPGWQHSYIHGGPKSGPFFKKCITPIYDDEGRRSIYPNVQLFIRSKTGILNVAIFKYSFA